MKATAGQAKAAHAVRHHRLQGRAPGRNPLRPQGACVFQCAALAQVNGGGMRVAQRIAPMAQRQRQHSHGVVFKVHVAHHAIGAAHQVAGKGLAQARALAVHLGQRVQPLLPQRQHGGRVARLHGVVDLVAQRMGFLTHVAQVAHGKTIRQRGQHHGHVDAACSQVAQALHFGGNGRGAAGVGHGAQGVQPQQGGQNGHGAVAARAVGRASALDPDLFVAQHMGHHVVGLGGQLLLQKGGVVRGGGVGGGGCVHRPIHTAASPATAAAVPTAAACTSSTWWGMEGSSAGSLA